MSPDPELILRPLIQDAVIHSRVVKKEFDKIRTNIKKVYKALGYSQTSLSDDFSKFFKCNEPTYIKKILGAVDHNPELLEDILDFALENPKETSIYA